MVRRVGVVRWRCVTPQNLNFRIWKIFFLDLNRYGKLKILT
jgi:hypothetical protein